VRGRGVVLSSVVCGGGGGILYDILRTTMVKVRQTEVVRKRRREKDFAIHIHARVVAVGSDVPLHSRPPAWLTPISLFAERGTGIKEDGGERAGKPLAPFPSPSTPPSSSTWPRRQRRRKTRRVWRAASWRGGRWRRRKRDFSRGRAAKQDRALSVVESKSLDSL